MSIFTMEISEERKTAELSSYLYAVVLITDIEFLQQSHCKMLVQENDNFDQIYKAIEDGEFILRYWSEFGFSESERILFSKFRTIFLEKGKDFSTIDSFEWMHIKNMAIEILQKFLTKKIQYNFKLPINLDKENFLVNVLDIIFRISSKEYQQRVWIDAIGPEVDSFDETCIHFDNCNIVLAHATEFGLNEEQKKKLKFFQEEFDKFSDENDWPPFFIDTPEWTRITELAKEVLVAFNHNYHKEL